MLAFCHEKFTRSLSHSRSRLFELLFTRSNFCRLTLHTIFAYFFPTEIRPFNHNKWLKVNALWHNVLSLLDGIYPYSQQQAFRLALWRTQCKFNNLNVWISEIVKAHCWIHTANGTERARECANEHLDFEVEVRAPKTIYCVTACWHDVDNLKSMPISWIFFTTLPLRV